MTLARTRAPESAPPMSAHEPARAAFARFWRCALQVNPASYSVAYRGQDHGLDEDGYNSAVAQRCEELGIKVVGIADHGSVDAVDRLRSVLSAKGVVVFPGFEIASTEKVHMVCLFPESTTKDQLNRYLGKLDLTDVEDGVRPSGRGCLEIARCVHDLGGIWYAAHLTMKGALLRLGAGDGGALTHIWTESALVRIAQIPGTVDTLEPKFQKILKNETPEYRRERAIVLINAKDVARPEQLAEPGASTWVKMTEPTFEAFKIAFLDPESRIRLDLPQVTQSALVSMRVQGGYLGGLEVHFSEHLNALIGGRGVGKSTLLECIRYALELAPKGKDALKAHQEVLKENLGKASGTVELAIRSTAHHGASFTVSRRYGEPPIVRDAGGLVSRQEPRDLLPRIEIYGQSEIFELAQDASSRVRLLDRFLPSDSQAAALRAELRKKLADNAAKLAQAELERDELVDTVGRLPKLQEQLEGFRKLGIEAKLDKVRLFEREKHVVARIDEELGRVRNALQGLLDAVPDLAFLGDKALEGLPNAASLAAIRGALEALSDEVARHGAELRRTLDAGDEAVRARKTEWRVALDAGERDLEEALASLPDVAGTSGREVGTAFKQLTQQIERIQPQRTRKAAFDQLVETLRMERQDLIAELSSVRSRRSAEMETSVKKLNDRLKGKLRIRFEAEGDREVLRELLLSCRLEGVGERRLSWIVDKGVTPLALARAIKQGPEALKDAFDLTPGVAEGLGKLPRSKLLELEALELGDLVEIELNVAHEGGENYRSLDRLSTGQKCTAVLHLLLLDNSDPLVVDQPEDNLDNAFIAERIVRELRDSKTERQFLFSTHNANIPVFGDAEWIGVLSAKDGHAELPPSLQGSIDVPEVRSQAAEILEGGASAFNQRKEMYGF